MPKTTDAWLRTPTDRRIRTFRPCNRQGKVYSVATMKPKTKPQTPDRPEQGAAGIIVRLSGGQITVLHEEQHRILLQRKVTQGFWCNRLWPVLRSL